MGVLLAGFLSRRQSCLFGSTFDLLDESQSFVLRMIVNLENYLPILLFILVGILVGVAPQVLGRLIAPYRPDAAKTSAYECGFEAFEDARMKFDVRYYLVAILFILFDLEVAFLVPWAVAMSDVGLLGFWAMMIFLGVLIVGLIFEWKKGALDWE
ncbi:MAG: dehydrogenase chain [Pseudomonadota bacterium]|jgi:NADH-quinone oxidoreductase subunit A